MLKKPATPIDDISQSVQLLQVAARCELGNLVPFAQLLLLVFYGGEEMSNALEYGANHILDEQLSLCATPLEADHIRSKMAKGRANRRSRRDQTIQSSQIVHKLANGLRGQIMERRQSILLPLPSA